jgi:hypothetical protein
MLVEGSLSVEANGDGETANVKSRNGTQIRELGA